MPNCSAIGCYNNQMRKVPGIYFHRYPADPIMRFKWILAVRRSNFTPNNSSRLCSTHFTEDDYLMNGHGKRLLKKNAIPSLFVFNKEIKSVADPTVISFNREMKARKTVSKKIFVRSDTLTDSSASETCNDDSQNFSECPETTNNDPSDVTSVDRDVSMDSDLQTDRNPKDDTRNFDPCDTSVDRDVMNSDLQDDCNPKDDQTDVSSSFRGTSPVFVDEPLNVSNELHNIGLIIKTPYIRTNLVSDSQNKIRVYRPALDIEECEKVLNEPLFKWQKKKRFVSHYKDEDITTPEMKNLFDVAKAAVDSQIKVISGLRKSQYRMTKRIKVLAERIREVKEAKCIGNVAVCNQYDRVKTKYEGSASCDSESLTEN